MLNQFIQKYSFSIIVSFVSLALLGLLLSPKINLDWESPVKQTAIKITYSWFGATPELVEKEITAPIESLVSTLEKVKDIQSASKPNSGEITIKFDPDKDVVKARFEVLSKIRSIKDKIPEKVGAINVTALNNNKKASPLLTVAINMNNTHVDQTEKSVTLIANNFSMIEGVEKIEVAGQQSKTYQLTANQNLLDKFGLTINDLAQKITESNYSSHFGSIAITENEVRQVLFATGTQSAHDFSDIILKYVNNTPIRIQNVATIHKAKPSLSNQIKLNGKQVIFLDIYSEFASNNIEVARSIKEAIQKTNHNYSDQHYIKIIDNQSVLLKTRILQLLQRLLLTIGILILFVLGVYRRFNIVFFLSISLLINLCISFLGYLLFNVSINLYSLAAITVSFGFLIDNNIIVIDHFRREKKIDIVIPIIATVLTTLVALIPIIVLKEETQNLLYDFSLVLIINLLISILISLFFLPALIYQLKWGNLSSRPKYNSIAKHLLVFQKKYARWVSHVYKRKVWYILLLILLFGLPFYKLPERIDDKSLLSDLYNNSIGHSWARKHIRPTFDVLTGGSLRLFDQYVFEGEYQEKNKSDELNITFKMQSGAPQKQLTRLVTTIESIIEPHTNQLHYITKVGANQAAIKIKFDASKEFYALASILRSEAVRIANNFRGVDWYIYGINKPFSNKDYIDIPHYAIAIWGYNYEKLLSHRNYLSQLISENERIRNIKTVAYRNLSRSDNKETHYAIGFDNHYKNYALSPIELSSFLSYRNIYSPFSFRWHENGSNQNLKFKINTPADVWSIDQGQFNSGYGNVNRALKQITLTKNSQSLHIIKKDQQYRLFIEFDYVGSDKYAKAHINNVVESFNENSPPGYFAKLQKDIQLIEQKENNNPWSVILIALVLIFAITAILFNNFSQALSILLFIPVSFIGVFFIFYLAEIQFDAGGYAALFLTSGLSVNALCFIFNEYNKLRKKRPSANALFLFTKSILRKIVPVGLTVISTIIGFIPFFINEPIAFWFNLSVGTIGGLIVSFLLLIIFPSVFLLNKKG